MIINEDVVPSSKFFKKRLDRVVDDVNKAFDKQSEVEDQVAKMTTELRTQIMKFKYNLRPVPHTLGLSRKDLPMLERLYPYLPSEFHTFDKWEDDEIETAIAVYPHIDKMINDLKWIDNERKKIREVAKTAPAGEKYAYDKCVGKGSLGIPQVNTYIRVLLNIKKELSKHRDLLN